MSYQYVSKIKCTILLILMVGISTVFSHEARIWTHSNGKKITGTLLEYKNEEAKIKFGESEILVKFKDLSLEDRTYLLTIAKPQEKNNNRVFFETLPDRGVCEKYLNFGENKNPFDGYKYNRITRETLTKMITENPDRKFFCLLTYAWIQGVPGKHIDHRKFIYLRETKELIVLYRQELNFETPQHVRWHEWTHWKNIEPTAWEKEIPYEVNEFKSDNDPRTAKSTFNLSVQDLPELMEWP